MATMTLNISASTGNTLTLSQYATGSSTGLGVSNLSAINSLELEFTLTAHTIGDLAQPSVAEANGNVLTLNSPFTETVTASNLGVNFNTYAVILIGNNPADTATVRCKVLTADVDNIPPIAFIDVTV